MLILVWFVVCIIFYFVQFLLGNSGHALEVFAVLSAIAIFLISKIRYRNPHESQEVQYTDWNSRGTDQFMDTH